METKKYDDANFHDSGNRGLHIGMFMGWAMLRGLSAEAFTSEVPRFAKQVEAAGKRFRFIGLLCDDKLMNVDLTDDGRQFADAYYETYLADYQRTLDDEDVSDGSWDHFTAVQDLLNERFTGFTVFTGFAGFPVVVPNASSCFTSRFGAISR